MARRASNSEKNKNFALYTNRGIKIYVEGRNNIEWIFFFSGYLSDFLKKKGEQFSKINPDLYNNKNFPHGVFVYIDFDDAEQRFYALVDGENNRYFLGRKVRK